MRSPLVFLGLSLSLVLGVVAALLAVNTSGAARADNAVTRTVDHDHDDDRKGGLPDAVRTALVQEYPGGEITEVEMERRVVKLWSVEVDVDGQMHEALVTAEGMIVEVERLIDQADAPASVRKRIAGMGTGAQLNELEQVEVRAELGWQPLAEARTMYEAEVMTNGHEVELMIGVDGSVTHEQMGDGDDDDDDDEADDDDHDDNDNDDDEDD